MCTCTGTCAHADPYLPIPYSSIYPQDVANWRRIATLAMQTGNTARALYPLDMVLRRDRGDVDAKWEKATVLAEVRCTFDFI